MRRSFQRPAARPSPARLARGLRIGAAAAALALGACQAPGGGLGAPPSLACAPATPPPADTREAGRANAPAGPRVATIYRDGFGVPHVVAATDAGAFYGAGYAQAEDRLPELLFLVLQVRGRLAEAFGGGCVPSDTVFRTLGFERAARAGLNTLPPALRETALRPFAAGINAYAAARRGRLAPWTAAALPVTETDILALHGFFGFVLSTINDPWGFGVGVALGAWGVAEPLKRPMASNAFAVRGARTASGNPILAINPHIHLTHPFIMYEARVKGASFDMRGATFMGLPFFIVGHNARLGWGVTVNYMDTFDRYFEIVHPASPDRYLFDGAWRAMTAFEETIAVKGGEPVAVTVHETVHGPVVARLADGNAISLSWATRGESGLAVQLERMNRARTMAEFEAALALLQTPNYGVMYADAEDNILYAYLGRVARRDERATAPGAPFKCSDFTVDWLTDSARTDEPCAALARYGDSLPGIPGWTGATSWNGVYGVEAYPREINPASGWMQMANTPPWVNTAPSGIARCGAPMLVAPCLDRFPYTQNARGIRFTEVLSREPALTLEAAAGVYLDSHVTASGYRHDPPGRPCVDGFSPVPAEGGERCGYLPALFAAWRAHASRLSAAERAKLSPGIALLRGWDGGARRDSPAAALFQNYVFALGQADATAEQRLQALGLAVDFNLSRYGRIDPPWGEVHTLARAPSPLRRGKTVTVPTSGSWQFLGTLHSSEGPYRPFLGSVTAGDARPNPDEDGKLTAAFGSVYMLAVEFGGGGVRALSAVPFGASEDPESPHFADQTALFGAGRLKPAWFAVEDIRANAKSETAVTGPRDYLARRP